MNLEQFLNFDKMITPSLIKIGYWIALVGVVLMGLVSLGTGMVSSYGGGAAILSGLLILVLGPIIVRIYFELLILAFRIYDVLRDIRSDLAAKPGHGI